MAKLLVKAQRVLFIFAIIASQKALAKDITVFDVRKTLPMTNEEKVYQDFYINSGVEAGLKPGMLVTITRRVSLYDTYTNKSPGELKVAVGRLKIIHAQKGISVARLHTLMSRSNRPILDYNFIMVGDQLDMKSLVMDRGGRKKTAAVEPKMTVPASSAQVEAVTAKVESVEMSSLLKKLPELKNLVVEQKL